LLVCVDLPPAIGLCVYRWFSSG